MECRLCALFFSLIFASLRNLRKKSSREREREREREKRSPQKNEGGERKKKPEVGSGRSPGPRKRRRGIRRSAGRRRRRRRRSRRRRRRKKKLNNETVQSMETDPLSTERWSVGRPSSTSSLSFQSGYGRKLGNWLSHSRRPGTDTIR